MRRIVKVQEAKTRLSAILADVERGDEVVVARGDVPVARLIPVQEPPERGLGFVPYHVPDAFSEPLPEVELAAPRAAGGGKNPVTDDHSGFGRADRRPRRPGPPLTNRGDGGGGRSAPMMPGPFCPSSVCIGRPTGENPLEPGNPADSSGHALPGASVAHLPVKEDSMSEPRTMKLDLDGDFKPVEMAILWLPGTTGPTSSARTPHSAPFPV